MSTTARLKQHGPPVKSLGKVMGLDEGKFCTSRRRLLHHVKTREVDNAQRQVSGLEEAYDAAYALARSLSSTLRRYWPDPALVISALVMHAIRSPEAPVIVRQYLQDLFNSPRDGR